MKNIHLITVGKLRDPHYVSLEKEYLKRINSFNLKIHELKPHSADTDKEGEDVLKKISEIAKDKSHFIVLLQECGKYHSSLEFSLWLFKAIEKQNKEIILIIGGAEGHGRQLIEKSNQSISLSPMTFPHQLARIILVEQLYRAQTIHTGHPYHK